jgi:hypothetical protein
LGDIAKQLKKLISAGDDDSLVKAVGTAEDIYGTMSGLYGYYGAAKQILGKLGFFGTSADPMEKISDLLNQIKTQLENMLGAILVAQKKIDAASELITLQLTDQQIASAKTAFDNAVVYVKNPTGNNKEQYDETISNSWTAVNLLSDLSLHYWVRLFVEEGLYKDAWTPPLYPDDTSPESKYIWDFRLTLLQFVKLLQRNLFVIAANTTEFQKDNLGRMKEYGDFLFANVYKKILAGFAEIKSPDPEEMKYVLFAMDPANFCWHRKEGHAETFNTYDFIDPKDGRRVRKERFTEEGIKWLRENRIPGGPWILANYVFGEVERYSGYDCTATYPVNELKAGLGLVSFTVPLVDADYNGWSNYWWGLVKNTVIVKEPHKFERFYENFSIRHRVRTLRRRKQLYNELGLPKLYNIIRNYYSTLHLEIPYELTELHNKYGSSSTRETYQPILASIKDNGWPQSSVSVRQMSTLLVGGQPVISVRQVMLLAEELAVL